MKRLYFIYTHDGKKYVDTCLGLKELSEFLERSILSVRNTLNNLRQGKQKHIKDLSGISYTLISEEDML